ncbi:hypothetical protein R3P38DRAFT_3190740 [Favolaschia claudopus]|uniref:Gag protein n=1 Tax=Favolaschia claudopus TaxID=2862362 RepID=A0AAW0BNJ5_9AGAR
MAPKHPRTETETPGTAAKRTRADGNVDPPAAAAVGGDNNNAPPTVDGGSAPGGSNASGPSPATNTGNADQPVNRSEAGVVNAAQDGNAVGAPALTEVDAVKWLNKLGVEPGAVAGAALPTLNAILSAVRANAVGATTLPDARRAVGLPADNARVAPAEGTCVTSADDIAAKVSILQELAQAGVLTTRVASWSVAELTRLKVLLHWIDVKNNTFDITHTPAKCAWGLPTAFNDTSNTLCVEGTSTPITLWIPGELAGQWWVDGEGYPTSRPAVSVAPMAEQAADYCKAQLNELCMPNNSSKVVEGFGPSQVKASRWMTTRATKSTPASIQEFKAVYNARKTLRDKALLQPLPLAQLKIRDFVVMEVRVGRYAQKDEGQKDDKGKRRAMDRWQTFYDLQAIYKIKDATEPFSAAPEVADFEI